MNAVLTALRSRVRAACVVNRSQSPEAQRAELTLRAAMALPEVQVDLKVQAHVEVPAAAQ